MEGSDDRRPANCPASRPVNRGNGVSVKSSVTKPLVVVFFASLFTVVLLYDEIQLVTGPYFDACAQLSKHAGGLDVRACGQYWEKNPGATGQEVVDHFTTQKSLALDMLLAESPTP